MKETIRVAIFLIAGYMIFNLLLWVGDQPRTKPVIVTQEPTAQRKEFEDWQVLWGIQHFDTMDVE